MLHRLLCLLVGYLCGGFLTAELVARARTGKSAAALGTGNPGMANLAHELGKGWGRWCWPETSPRPPWPSACAGRSFPHWAACPACGRAGAVLGHNFPFWRGFRGGKGVAVTCAALILFSPLWGTAACLAGLAVTLLSGWLPPGGGGDPRPVCPPGLPVPRPGGRAAGPDSGPDHALPAHPGLGRILRGEEERKFRGR